MFILLPTSNESENGETKSIFLGDSGRAVFWELFFSCSNKMIAWMLKVNHILSRLCKIYFKHFKISLFKIYFHFQQRHVWNQKAKPCRSRTCSLWLAEVLWWEGSQLSRGRQNQATGFLLASVFKRHTLNMVLGICQRAACWLTAGMPGPDQLIAVRWEGVRRETWNQKQLAEGAMWCCPEIHRQGQISLFSTLKLWFQLNVISS